MNAFDLERAISTWRQFIAKQDGIEHDDLDELEQHLRDDVERHVAEGLTVEEAYRASLSRMGGLDHLARNYAAVRWDRSRADRGVAGALLERWKVVGRHLRVSVRHLARHPGFSLIHVAGLAFGLACCLLMALLVREELSFDRFHENADNIYRVYFSQQRPDRLDLEATSPMPLGPALADGVSSIEHAVRVQGGSAAVMVEDRPFRTSVTFVDAGFLDVFTFPLLSGDAETALDDLSGIVISEDIATAWFGRLDVVGETVSWQSGDQPTSVTISGVAENPPEASSIPWDVLARMELSPVWATDKDNENSYNHELFVAMTPGTSVDDVLPEFQAAAWPVVGGFGSYLNEMTGQDPDTGTALQVGLQPLTAMHLDDRLPANREGVPTVLAVLSLVALLVLLSGVINFVTLSTGRAAGRAREIGIRRIVGADSRQIGRQVWLETGLLSTIALFIGILLTWSVLGPFNEFVRRNMSLSFDAWTIATVLGLFLLTTLMAGAYPRWIMLRIPALSTVGSRSVAQGGGFVTKALLVVQFSVVMVFAIALVTMGRQVSFLKSADPGFEQEHVLAIPLPSQLSESALDQFRMDALTIAGVVDISMASNALGQGETGGTRRSVNTFGSDDVEIAANLLRVDASYLNTLDLELVEGRMFQDTDADVHSVVVNETLWRMVSDRQRVGDVLPGFDFDDGMPVHVIGVVQDFHFESMRDPIRPLLMYVMPRAPYFRAFVRVAPGTTASVLAQLEELWSQRFTTETFTASFLDDDVDRQYRQEQVQLSLAGGAMGLALLIASCGLIGLAVLASTRRRKEIGIRKALGASVFQMVALLSRPFAALVIIAFVVAAPLGWMGMNAWLETFAYRTSIGAGSILAAGALVLVLALSAVSIQTIRAARTNPTETLRSE